MDDGGPDQGERESPGERRGEAVRFWGDLGNRGNGFFDGLSEAVKGCQHRGFETSRLKGWSWHPVSGRLWEEKVAHIQLSGKQPGVGAEWVVGTQVWGSGAMSAADWHRLKRGVW